MNENVAVDTVQFLLDEPSSEDAFGSHSRVAKAVSSVLLNNDEIGIVGLVGSWGSGKSTVVRYIKSHLNADPSHEDLYFFTYDAWLHQNDPPRRAFLETLIEELIPSYLTDEDKWRSSLADLSGRSEETETETSKSLTKTGKWIFLSLGLVPLGVSLLNFDLINASIGDHGDLKPSGVALATQILVVSLLLTSAPLLVIGSFYLRWRPWLTGIRLLNPGQYLTKVFWTKNRPENAKDSIVSLLTDHSIERTEKKTKISPEPTSIEFRMVFRDILTEIGRSKKTLIIVIDNLDRLAEHEAIQLWATIRSLFLGRRSQRSNGDAALPQLKVILPIDGGSIRRMFAASHPQEARELAASFLNKTFDISFSVNEPVMSNWRAFLLRQMQSVFGGIYEPSWGFWTRRLLEEFTNDKKKSITPREINKTVNQIASLYIQWKEEEIAVEVLALFAIYRDDIGQDILSFLDRYSFELEKKYPDFRLQLASVYYGVPRDQAAQVLLEEPIRSAVKELNRGAFESRFETPGFAETFETVISSMAADSETTFIELTNAALLLREFKGGDEVANLTSWQAIIDSSSEASWPDRPQQDLSLRLSSLFDHATEEQAEALLASVVSNLENLLAADAKNQASTLRQAVLESIRFSESRKLDTPTFEIEADADQFLVRLSQFASNSDAWQQLRTDLTGEQLAPAIQELGRSAITQAHVPNVVSLLRSDAGTRTYRGDEEISWEPIVADLNDVARNGAGQGLSAAHALRALGLLITKEEPAATTVKSLISDGIISARLADAGSNERWDELATTVAILIWSGENFRSPDDASWSQLVSKNSDLPRDIFNRLKSFFDADTMRLVWISRSKAYSSSNILEEIMGYMIKNRDLASANTSHVLQNMSFYRSHTPYRLRNDLVAILEARSNFWDQLEALSIGNALKEAAIAVAKKGDAEKERAQEIIYTKLKNATSELWTKALWESAEPFSLATDFLSSDSLSFDHTSPLFSSLTTKLDSLITSADKAVRHRWFALARCLAPKATRKAHHELGSAILLASPRNALAIFKASEIGFLKSSGLRNKPDIFVEKVVLPLSKLKEGRAWLRDNQQALKSIITRSGDKMTSRLQDELSKFVAGKREEPRYWAEVISSSWGTKLKQ